MLRVCTFVRVSRALLPAVAILLGLVFATSSIWNPLVSSSRTRAAQDPRAGAPELLAAAGEICNPVSPPDSTQTFRCASGIQVGTVSSSIDRPPDNATREIGDVGLSGRGIRPAPGTRVRPEGIPENWRIRGTKEPGGTEYIDPTNPHHRVRVMQGDPASPYPNSRSPYVRWQAHGQPLDVHGNKLPSAQTGEAHIPLEDFRFDPGPFQ